MTTKELLTSLGLSSYEADVYEALVRLERAKVQDLTRIISVPRPQIYVALGRLMDKGVVIETRGKVSLYSAVPPDAAFHDTLKLEEETLKAKHEGVRKLAESHRELEKEDVPPDFVQVLKGRQLGSFMDDLAAQVEREILIYFKSAQEKSEKSLEAAVRLEEDMLERGVKVRCLYEKASLANEALVPILKRAMSHGEQARVVESVPMNLSVFDDRAALFSLTTEKGDVTVFAFSHPALVAVMKAGFEYLWDKGTSLREVLRKKQAGRR